MAKKNNALQLAIDGKVDGLSEKQAKSALMELGSKFSSLNKRAQKAMEHSAEAGGHLVHTAETQGSLFLSSLAAGYLGPEKLKLGGRVDVRLILGLAAEGYGLYDCLQGGGKAADHSISIGDGILGSYLAEVALDAGRTLAANKNKEGAAAAPAGNAPAGTSLQGEVNLLPSPNIGREIFVTPAVEGDDDFEGPRRRERVRGRRSEAAQNRFRTATPAQELEDEEG